jgi:hypothetical protein
MNKNNYLQPTFLGIGVIKCGTTWLAEVLAGHPDIFVAHGKETHFFSHHYDRGLDFYLKNFIPAKNEKAIGEFSVTYMLNSEEIARRIYEFNPRIRLLVVVRNPIERAFSEYSWRMQRGQKLGSFRDALKSVPQLTQNGYYYKNLTPYWNLFTKKQILIILFDDIKNDPVRVQKQTFSFLEVEASFKSHLTKKIIGKTINPRFQSLENFRIRLHEWSKKKNKPYVITWIKKTGLSSFYRKLNNRGKNIPNLTLDDKSVIYSELKDDMQKFQDKTSLDISSWHIK